MRYEVSLEINRSREEIIDIFTNPDQWQRWQPTLDSYQFISGNLGEEGSKMKIVYAEKNRKIELIETIIENRMPEYFAAEYTSGKTENFIRNWYEESGDQKTTWIMESEFRFKGLMYILGPLLKPYLKKTSLKFMNNFKLYAENRMVNQALLDTDG